MDVARELISAFSGNDTLLLPLEVHVFDHGGDRYVFDCRNFTILRVAPVVGAVLERARWRTLAEISHELSFGSNSSHGCYRRETSCCAEALSYRRHP
jgi:hypothetical protein